VRDQSDEDQYRKVIGDLKRFELDLYMNLPGKFEEAILRLERAIYEDPQNYDLLVAYASMIEDTDFDKSVELYKRAVAADSTQEIAYFNLGAMCYSRAKGYYEEAGLETDRKKYEMLMDLAEDYFMQSVAYFERTLEINPESLEAVIALKNIAYITDDKPKYLYYQAIERRIRGE
jgi:tetratricopeptide (TPR) repeat protein